MQESVGTVGPKSVLFVRSCTVGPPLGKVTVVMYEVVRGYELLVDVAKRLVLVVVVGTFRLEPTMEAKSSAGLPRMTCRLDSHRYESIDVDSFILMVCIVEDLTSVLSYTFELKSFGECRFGAVDFRVQYSEAGILYLGRYVLCGRILA